MRRPNAELNRNVKMPDVAARFTAIGAEPVAATPEAFAAVVRSQMATVKDVAVRARIPTE